MKKSRGILSGLCALTMCLNLSVAVNAATVPSNANLLNTYGSLFGKSGNAIPAQRMYDGNIMRNFVKPQYNSLTAENEMKPDSILNAWSPKQISVSQARQMGYYIPAGYSEPTVPQLNFNEVDKMLKVCKDNGIGMRGHTLVWHSQTPDWFFKSGYSNNGQYVNQAQMNKRMEMYIKTVINHVHKNQNGSVVYAWDVVNEFLHADGKSGWQKIYGAPSTNAQFVKDAFNYAYDALNALGLAGKVKLFYNDYNTYMEVNDVIKLINFINSGKKVCAGVGMQSHLSTNFPSVDYYTAALKSFLRAGFEVQVTELDVGSPSQDTQAKYCYDLMKAILAEKKAGGNISAIVWWGLADDTSWRGNDNALLFSRNGIEKPSYRSVLQAYFDSGLSIGSTSSQNPNQNQNQNQNTGTVAPGETAKLQDGWYYIKNVNAQKYLQVTNNTGKAAQNVELRTGTGAAGQKWYLKNVGNGYVTLQSALGDFMLDIANAKNEDGANTQIYNSHSGTAQQFMLKTTSTNGAYVVATKCSNLTKVLDDYNFGTSDGTNVCQWSYGGKNNQLWVFESTNNGSTSTGGNTNTGTTTPEQKPQQTDGKLSAEYSVSNWGGAYQVNFKINNKSNADVNSWTLKLKKSEVNIASSWNINVKEEGEYLVITPMSYNSFIGKGGSIEFGFQGKGTCPNTLNYTLN